MADHAFYKDIRYFMKFKRSRKMSPDTITIMKRYLYLSQRHDTIEALVHI